MNDTNKGAKLSMYSIGSLFGDTWKMYRERFVVLSEIILLPSLALILGNILILFSPVTALFGGLIILAAYVFMVFAALALIYSIHNKTGVDASYNAVWSLFWGVIWIGILKTLAIVGGFMMLIIPGIWLSIALSLVTYVFVIEGRRGIDALRQSKDYIKGYWWAYLGRISLLGLLTVVLAAVTCLILFPIFLLMGNEASNIISSLIAPLVIVIVVPFELIYGYLMFKNLRELKPELVDTQTKQGSGFVKTSAIIGIVGIVLMIIGLIAGAALIILRAIKTGDSSNSANNYDYQMMQDSSSTTTTSSDVVN